MEMATYFINLEKKRKKFDFPKHFEAQYMAKPVVDSRTSVMMIVRERATACTIESMSSYNRDQPMYSAYGDPSTSMRQRMVERELTISCAFDRQLYSDISHSNDGIMFASEEVNLSGRWHIYGHQVMGQRMIMELRSVGGYESSRSVQRRETRGSIDPAYWG